MYKYETHMHTLEASACANSDGAQMAEKYKAEGYTGIIVTDHFFNGNTCIPGDMRWEKRVELFCKGYENARERGQQIGLDVFFGFEYCWHGSDFLIYGLEKEWLLDHDDVLEWDLARFLEYVHMDGGRAIHAHPFRDYSYIKYSTLAPHLVDGIEVINASHSDPEFDKRARLYAEWYDLPVTAGSDSHDTNSRWFPGGVMSERKFTSALDYAEAAVKGEVILLDKNGQRS